MTLLEQMAVWEAEDAAELARANAKRAYFNLIAKYEDEQLATGIYLTDENVDHENSEHEIYDSLAYWEAMIRSAECAYTDRSESKVAR